MSTLFFRIFLGVGSAMLLALVATVLISLRMFGGAMEDGFLGGPRELVRDAAGVLDREGEPGLKRWLERRAKNRTTVVFIIDADGHDLLGRPISRRWIRLARQGRSRTDRPGNYRPPRYLPRLIGPDGSEYTLVVAPRRFTALSILGWPGNRLLILLGIIVISGLISLLLARYIARPVSRLTEATDALAEGRLDTRIGPELSARRDELGTLAKAFDAMADRIQSLVWERENLLRDVSHELRSPLARLKLALALAQRNTPNQTGTDLARIEKESDLLETLIEQMLAWVRLGSDALQHDNSVQLDSIVDEIIADARFLHGENSIVFATTVVTCLVRGDRRALHSALENVVLNAIQFSPPCEAIHVCLRTTDEHAVFTVRDRGPGVPEAHLQQIFAPLFQVDTSRTPNQGGYGIGLAITARVTQLHNGKVSARNVASGGLEVRLELPLAAMTSVKP